MGVGQKLAFQLESRLFGRQQNQGRAVRLRPQRLADFLQAQESFSCSGRSQQKTRVHPVLVAQNQTEEKIFPELFVTTTDFTNGTDKKQLLPECFRTPIDKPHTLTDCTDGGGH
jgi:hypothetical protein